jgi:16S rRNA processing protein RimM
VSAPRVWIGKEQEVGRFYEVERSRAYRDRLVLKLRGIEDGNAAARLRGRLVGVAPENAQQLPEGRYHRAQLVGLEAVDEGGVRLGRVEDVVPTRAHDLLQIKKAADPGDETEELLVPCVSEIVLEVDLVGGRMVLRLPPGLQDLNRR